MTPYEHGYLRTMKVAGIGTKLRDGWERLNEALPSAEILRNPWVAGPGTVAAVGMTGAELADPKYWATSPLDRAYYAVSDTDENQSMVGGLGAAALAGGAMLHPGTRRRLMHHFNPFEGDF